ncbi:MAG: tRNA lysidine(34) synthetase TilS, partial [Pseudomonadota bacterium]
MADGAPILVAISGGSDSTALLVGFQEYLSQMHVAVDIVAVTVDHGLRANSALEAEQVGALCDNLNIRHVVKKWQAPESASGIQAAARNARYSLIGEVAHDMDAQFVMTGHTLDDQLETIAMRSARGEGRGLAGIPSATLYACSTWFVRPLLGTSRMNLRNYLSDCGMR